MGKRSKLLLESLLLVIVKTWVLIFGLGCEGKKFSSKGIRDQDFSWKDRDRNFPDSSLFDSWSTLISLSAIVLLYI